MWVVRQRTADVGSTYVVPEPTLPLVQPLVNAGVPASITNPLNKALTPIVEEGYSQYTPKGGPYISGGKIVGISGGKIVGLNVQTPSLSFKPPTQAVKITVRGKKR